MDHDETRFERILYEHPFFDFLMTTQNELLPHDPLLPKMVKFVKMWDYLIDFLRQDFPNPHINDICTLAWRLIGSKIVPCGQMLERNVSSVTFAMMQRANVAQPMILIPNDWCKMASGDRSMALGSIVMASSQARDYYNGRIHMGMEKGEVEQRAKAYEAEMLLVLQGLDGFEPNPYQADVMRRFPNGIHTSPGWLYSSKRFEAPEVVVAGVEMPGNQTTRAGRNDPCSCGSGRKFKQCCMRR